MFFSTFLFFHCFSKIAFTVIYAKTEQDPVLSPMNTSPQVNSSPAEGSSSALLVSRRRLAFRPPSLLNKKTTTAVSTDKAEANNVSSASSVVLSNPKSTALECAASSSKGANATSAEITTDKTRRMYWTLDEQAVFYEALKLHGKDFETISKFMLKKKFNKDKDQVRNYYLNTFKVWKCKAQIEDADWENIPRDARELIVLLNGFEWRKRLKGLPFEEKKFRQLVMEGFSSFRPKRRKFIVNLKTPCCPALLKYFPYDKRNCEIPQHLTVKLKPLRNRDKEFVVASEQNPFLLVQINVNDKISSLFGLIKRKWLQKNVQVNNDGRMVGIRLFVGESNHIIHNVHVGIEGNSPLWSLTKLKKDFSPSPIKAKAMGSPIVSGRQPNEIKLSASSVKEVFELNEGKIRAGLAEDEVGNASMLQLFYMLGMKKELSFSYQIFAPEPRFHSWTVFKSLVARDYDELTAKGIGTMDVHSQPSNSGILEMATTTAITNAVIHRCVSPLSAAETSRSQNRRLPCTKKDVEIGIVEQENAQFVEQLKTHCNILQQKRPKRQIKLVPDNHRKLIRVTAPLPRQQQLVNGVVAHNQHMYMPGTAVCGPTMLNMVVPHQMSDAPLPVHHQLRRVERVVPNTSTDFSILQRFPIEFHRTGSFSNCNTQFVPTTDSPSSSLTANTAIELTLNGELSLDSSTTISQFHPTVLDSSPSKTLPEDVRTACEQMLKENSVDYCRQFEQLTSLHNDGSPLKTFEGNKP